MRVSPLNHKEGWVLRVARLIFSSFKILTVEQFLTLKKHFKTQFEESIQNGKKVFTIVDGSIRRGNRRAGISASMVFNENTTTTLKDVKGNL